MENQTQPHRNLKKYLLPVTSVIIVVLLYRYQTGIVTSASNFPLDGRKTVAVQHVSSVKETSDFKWSPFMDVLDEDELMNEQPLTDYRKGLNIYKSKVILLGSSTVFHVGDEIKISITALDGFGNLRKRGGDQFRVRIYEKGLKAAACGYVIDHKNGTYTAVVRALWSGKADISVAYGYSREVIRAWYDTFKKLHGTSSYLANYQVTTNSVKERLQGLCHPILYRITSISKDFCNRTMQNGGAALYCSKPKRAHCKGFVGYKYRFTNIRKIFTKAELDLYNGYGTVLKSLKVMVKEYPHAKTLPACTKYNVSSLWMMESPTGYFYKNSWNLVHCPGPSEQSFEKCLKNKHIILVGDSTLKQWFRYLVSAFNCKMTTDRKMYKVCHNIDLNMMAEISLHSIPGHYHTKEPIIHSIPYFIETYNFSPKLLLVFHMQSHLSYYHPRVFKLRMLEIRKSIDFSVRIHKKLRLFVKGPHTFYRTSNDFPDYFGYVYRTIMLEVFEGLFDRIVYLDSKDITISTAQIDVHPTEEVVRGMVKQFLSYVCDDE